MATATTLSRQNTSLAAFHDPDGGQSEANTFGGGGSQNSRDLYELTLLMWNGSGSAIAAGSSVQLDLTSSGFVAGKWVKKTAASADGVSIGNVTEDLANGAWGRVRVKGYAPSCIVDAGVAKGDMLQQSATAGQYETTGGATQRNIGQALAAASGGKADVWLF